MKEYLLPLTLAAILHDITKIDGIPDHDKPKRYVKIGLLSKEYEKKTKDSSKLIGDPDFIGAISATHHDKIKSETLFDLKKKINSGEIIRLRDFVAIADRTSAEIEKPETKEMKRIHVDLPLFADPISGKIYERIVDIDRLKLKKVLHDITQQPDRALHKLTMGLLGEDEEFDELIKALKYFPNDTRFPSNDTTLLSHSLSTAIIANIIYSMVSTENYKVCAFIFDHSANDWLTKVGRTTELKAKDSYIKEFLKDFLLELSKSADADVHPITTMIAPSLIDKEGIHIVNPWIFVMCESVKNKFEEVFTKTLSNVVKKYDVFDIFRFELFYVSGAELPADERLDEIKKLLRNNLREIFKKVSHKRYDSRVALNLDVPDENKNYSSYSEQKLCEYCGFRVGIKDERNRICCERCRKVIGREKGVLIDDISDEDKLIAVVGFRIRELDKLLYQDMQIEFNGVFGRKIEWNPARMTERLRGLYNIGKELNKKFTSELNKCLENKLIEEKVHINIVCEIFEEGVDSLVNTFGKFEFEDKKVSCYIRNLDQNKVTLEIFGLPERYSEKLRIGLDALLEGLKVRIIDIKGKQRVKVDERIFQIINRVSLVENVSTETTTKGVTLEIAYIIPAKFTFHAIAGMCDFIAECKLDQDAEIFLRVEKENYPLYVLLKEIGG